MKDIINNVKKSDTWKIQLTMANYFISSIDNDEERVMHSKAITWKSWLMTKLMNLYDNFPIRLKIDNKII